MSAKKKRITFHRTKGSFEDCDPDLWDDLAVVKAYNMAISNEKHDQWNMSVSNAEVQQTENDADEQCMENAIGEVVWSRAPAVEVTEYPDSNEQNLQHTSYNLPRNKASKKKWKNRKRNKQKNSNDPLPVNSAKWEIGNSCMAFYQDDELYYKATIKEMHPDQGTVVVAYDDYDEDEVLAVKDIYPESLWTNAGVNLNHLQKDVHVPNGDAESVASVGSKTKKKKSKRAKKSSQSQNQSHSQVNSSFFDKRSVTFEPPPPFMPMFDGPVTNGGPFPNLSSIQMGVNQNTSNDTMSSMLVSWYMAGYHTGYYRGLSNRSQDE